MLESIAFFAVGSYIMVEVAPRVIAWTDSKSGYTVEVQTSDEYKKTLQDLDAYRDEKVLKK